VLHGGNQALWAILNRPPEMLIGKTCDDLFINKEEAEAFNARYDEVFRTGKTDISEEVFTDETGQQHILSVKMALIQDGFEPTLVAIAHDISDLKRTEDRMRQYTKELENSNRELDDFAYIASHDLKEPLRGMQSFSQFVLEDYSDKIDDEGKRKLRAISDLTKRLDNLLNVLLQYSRLGRTALATGPCDIGEIVQRCVNLYDISLKEKKATVDIAKDWPAISCDRVRIAEVFQNLIGNALKYTDKPENKIEIGYTIGHPHVPGEYAFYVRDHGIGIPEKFLNSIFKIFKRLHAKEAYGGGTGSGLAIAKKIIVQHGGQIWAESEGEGHGATFYFTIPQKK
jgi:PAS domain S-box-containing protein